MAITFVGAEKITEAEGGAVLDPTVPKPAATAEGDLILLTVTTDGDNPSISLPAEFTVAFNGNVPSNAVGPTRKAVGWKLAGSNEPAGYTVTFGALDGYSASCAAWTGVDSSNPVNVSYVYNEDGSSTTIPDTPSVTVPAAGDVLITIASVARGPSFEDMNFDDHYTPPSGVTEVVDVNYGAGTSYSGHAIGWETIASAGASGTRTWTCFENDDGGHAGALVLHVDTGASVFFEGSATAVTEAKGVLGDPEPINHVETVTGSSSGTGTISLSYPASMASGHLAIASITADNGNQPVTLPSGYTSITQPYGELMEETIRKAAGKITGDINPAYAETVYAGGRTGATYLAIPVHNGNQILWQDGAGTVPASADGDPVMRLDDISGLGYHAIQSSGVASLTLRTDGTNYWIEVAESDDRPIIPVGAISANTSTLVMGLDQTRAARSVLMSPASSSSGFLFVALDGSTSTTMYADVTIDAIRTDTTGSMADYPIPSNRDGNHTLYTESEIITFQGVEFGTVWTGDSAGVHMLGYSSDGWPVAGKFYGMAIVDGDGFQAGVPRGDGTLAFTPGVGYRVIDGTEGASADFGHDAAEEAVASISLFKLVDIEGGPLDVQPVQLSETGDGSATLDDDRFVPSIETATDGAVIVHIITNGQATTGHTPPSGVTEIADLSIGTGEDGTSLAVGWEQLRQAGTYPQKTWEIATETITPYRSYSLALKPLYEPVSLFESNVLGETHTTGTLSAKKRLSGSATGAMTVSGSLRRITSLSATPAVTTTAATATLGSKVSLGSADLVSEVETQGKLVLGISLGGTALGEALASATKIPLKRLLSGSAEIVAESHGDLDRGSLPKAFAEITTEATGSFLVRRGLKGSAVGEGSTSGAFLVKRRFTRGRVTAAATATGAFLRYAGLKGRATITAQASARLESYAEVHLEGHAVIETFAVAGEAQLLATFSEDVVAMGLATIIQDFGGRSDRRTITLNPPDRTINVGRRSGY